MGLPKICLLLGIAVYAASFFLPAVRAGGESMQGYFCAWITLTAITSIRELDRVTDFLAIPIGWINPLAVAYLGLRAADKRIRIGVAMVALALIPVTWVYLAAEGIGVLIGHVLWVVGLFMMMAPEVIRAVRRRIAGK